jgi:hypothetical protein
MKTFSPAEKFEMKVTTYSHYTKIDPLQNIFQLKQF